MSKEQKRAVLLLEDGTYFEGVSIAGTGTATGEICFNTGTTGYQEIFTDPSYFGQLMVTTNAHIGNYGIHSAESQSSTNKIAGLVCRNFSYEYARPLAQERLLENFEKEGLFGITSVDTRAVVRHIRDKGAMNAIIATHTDLDALKAQLSAVPDMNGLDLASKVSTKEAYHYGDATAKYKVSVLDLGVKKGILDCLAARDCYLKVFPCDASFEDLASFQPDGYFLSNGPGDPKPLHRAQLVAKTILEKSLPLFGICLGHQVIAIASGVKTYKMHNGHRGINHPVKNLLTGKGEITSQNHGFVLDKSLVESNDDLELTHIHLNDQTVAGIRVKGKPCFSVQYHPEACPGPNDSKYLFDDFVKMLA